MSSNQGEDSKHVKKRIYAQASDDIGGKPKVVTDRNSPTTLMSCPAVSWDLTRGQLMFVIWFVWIGSGALYYAYGDMKLGFCKGFYMAVNVGYSIGFGYPAEDTDPEYWFSTLHVVIGASMVGLALGFFGDQVMSSSTSWSQNLELKKKYNDILARRGQFILKLEWYVRMNYTKCRILVVFFLFTSFGTYYCMGRFNYSFAAGMYNAISSMSTGGLHAMPIDATDADYFVWGLLSAFGVPLMGIAMGVVANDLMGHDTLEDVEEVLEEPIHVAEIDEMRAVHGVGFKKDGINKHEFVLLSAVRLGYMDVDTIGLICKKFDSFGANGEISDTKLMELSTKKPVGEAEMNPMQKA